MNNLANKIGWSVKCTPIYIGVVFSLCMSNIMLAQSTAIETDMALPLEEVLEDEMTALDLAQNQVHGFNERAMQKLEDFADAMTILGDPEIELELRKEVAKAVLGFFREEGVTMRWYDLEMKKNIEPTLGSLLEKTLSENRGVKVQVSNISGGAPRACPPPSCSWDLNFQIVQKPENGAAISLHATMTVVLEKKGKYFGDTKKEVWEVFLGEMKKIQFRP